MKLIAKGEDYEFLKPWLGDGLLLSSGEKWKRRRKMLTPSFHFNILKQFISIMENQGSTLIGKLANSGNPIDIHPLVSLYTLDVIAESAMGVKLNSQFDSNSNYVKAVKEISAIIVNRIFTLFLRSDIIFKLTPAYRTYKRHLNTLHNFTRRIIQERRVLLEKEKSETQSPEENGESIGVKKRLSFLDKLILSDDQDGKLNDEDIREEVDTFMFEGHDTTASGITFLLYSVAQYPEVQKKIYEEQLEIFGENMDREITFEDLGKMKYAELVIKETLRLYPSVPLIMRMAPDDINLNGTELPAGTRLVVNLIAMNRNPAIFNEPLQFSPERFLPENTSNRHPFSYIPFSAGPRNCIGQKFAMLEMKSVLSKCTRKLILSLGSNEPLQLGGDLVLKSHNGVYLKFKQR